MTFEQEHREKMKRCIEELNDLVTTYPNSKPEVPLNKALSQLYKLFSATIRLTIKDVVMSKGRYE